MNKGIAKELSQRGTCEVIDGKAHQVTQAIDEKQDEVTLMVFGELKNQKIRPIGECCPICDSGARKRFNSDEECQNRQKKDGADRGFTMLICPKQFID